MLLGTGFSHNEEISHSKEQKHGRVAGWKCGVEGGFVSFLSLFPPRLPPFYPSPSLPFLKYGDTTTDGGKSMPRERGDNCRSEIPEGVIAESW